MKITIKKYLNILLIVLAIIAIGVDMTNDSTDAKTLYEQNEKTVRNQVRASHILVDTNEQALKIKSDIESGKITFADAAAKYSKCPSGRNGGDLNYFSKGMMVKPFEEAAFSLPVGKVSNPVQTQFGYHLIVVTGEK